MCKIYVKKLHKIYFYLKTSFCWVPFAGFKIRSEYCKYITSNYFLLTSERSRCLTPATLLHHLVVALLQLFCLFPMLYPNLKSCTSGFFSRFSLWKSVPHLHLYVDYIIALPIIFCLLSNLHTRLTTVLIPKLLLLNLTARSLRKTQRKSTLFI